MPPRLRMGEDVLQRPLSRIGFRVLTALAGGMPERAIRPVAALLAPFHAIAFPARRRAVTQNLAVVAGGSAWRRLRLLLSVCACYNAYFLEFLRLARLTPADVLARTRVEGDPHVRDALASGRGIVLVTSHIGNWEWCAAWLAARAGRRVLTPTGVQLTEALHPHVATMKRRHRVEVVQARDGYRGLYRALERGEIVGLALDGDVFQTGRRVQLCGRDTVLGSGAARLAQRTGALVLHLTCVRTGGARFTLTCEPLIGGLTPECVAVESLDAAVRDVQERQIRAHAGQWCMFRPLWPPVAPPVAPPVPAAAPVVSTPAVWTEARHAS